MKDDFNKSLFKGYGIRSDNVTNLTEKVAIIKDDSDKVYYRKQTLYDMDQKYKFLESLKVSNVLYPIKNNENDFVEYNHNNPYYLTLKQEKHRLLYELKMKKMIDNLYLLHMQTQFEKKLDPKTSKYKFKEIFDYLDYKFSSIEVLVRSVEEGIYDEESILILKNYHYILDAKEKLAYLNKKIISYVKERKSVYYCLVHNNPKLDHLLITDNTELLTSFEKAKIGIASIDLAKLYIECEDVNVNKKEIFGNYFKNYDDSFYFDYFCFLVMLYYIKGMKIMNKDYLTSQNFSYTASKLNLFCKEFGLESENVK